MQVILLEKIYRLGALGDQVAVKPGFARNFLFPMQKAVSATSSNVAKFEARRAELEKAAAENLEAAQKRAQDFTGLALTILARASDEGRLYGSIGPREMAEALQGRGLAVEKKEIRLSAGPIRQIGEHGIQVQLHSDVIVPIQVTVEAEK